MDRPDVVLRLPVIGELQTGMESAAAATWAGDVGSALADWRVGVDKAREPKGHLMKQLDHYWATRAAKDLNSDIEAWSVSQARKSLPTNLRRLSDMLLYYYSGVKTGEKLRNAFREFAKYYSSSGSTRMDVLRIRKQIVEFAHMWLLKRMREGYQPRYRETDFDWAADELTSRFLIYIEDRM